LLQGLYLKTLKVLAFSPFLNLKVKKRIPKLDENNVVYLFIILLNLKSRGNRFNYSKCRLLLN